MKAKPVTRIVAGISSSGRSGHSATLSPSALMAAKPPDWRHAAIVALVPDTNTVGASPLILREPGRTSITRSSSVIGLLGHVDGGLVGRDLPVALGAQGPLLKLGHVQRTGDPAPEVGALPGVALALVEVTPRLLLVPGDFVHIMRGPQADNINPASIVPTIFVTMRVLNATARRHWQGLPAAY